MRNRVTKELLSEPQPKTFSLESLPVYLPQSRGGLFSNESGLSRKLEVRGFVNLQRHYKMVEAGDKAKEAGKGKSFKIPARFKQVASKTPAPENPFITVDTSVSTPAYENALKAKDLIIYPIENDGNCLFRAVAHQVYGNQELHKVVCEKCVLFMQNDADYFSDFVEDNNITEYLDNMALVGYWGGHIELQVFIPLYANCFHIRKESLLCKSPTFCRH